MSKKGFTLIELLATIVIIALIMSIVMPSAYRLSQRNSDKKYKEYEKMMVEYAKVSELKGNDIIDLFELKELEKVKNECVGYVSINHTTVPETYTAHISCGDQYESPEFDENISNPVCPGCKFMFVPNYEIYPTWFTSEFEEISPTVITSGYYNSVQELVNSTGRHYFLGLKLNNENMVTNAYVCGVKEGLQFCVEGANGNSKYEKNKRFLQQVYDNTCHEIIEEPGTQFEHEIMVCGPWQDAGTLSVRADDSGGVFIGNNHFGNDMCAVNYNGYIKCDVSVG